MIEIQRMTQEDLKEILVLEDQLFSSPWKEEHFLYELEVNPFSSLYIMRDKNEIVGYGGLWLVFEQADLTSIGIKPSEQGKGYAKRLLRYLIHEAKEAECEYILLEVRVSNHRAQKLYEQFGFQQVGIKKNYYSDNNEDAISMCKILVGDEDERY